MCMRRFGSGDHSLNVSKRGCVSSWCGHEHCGADSTAQGAPVRGGDASDALNITAPREGEAPKLDIGKTVGEATSRKAAAKPNRSCSRVSSDTA